MRPGKTWGRKPPTTFGSRQPSKASNRAQAIAMILSRMDNGLEITPAMLAPFGIKSAEAERMITEAGSRILL